MPLLPSGKVVGISNERARYHASRQGVTVTRDTPLEQLYPLVDILIADSADSPSSWNERYRFSGHTLADRQWLSQWDQLDLKLFLQWLQEKSQQQEIEGVRTKLIYDELPQEVISHAYPQHLYSLLQRRIEAMPMKRATVQQWRNTIRNMGKCGIREEEMQWSGIMDLFSGFQDRQNELLEKQQLVDAIDFTAIRLELSNERMVSRDDVSDFVPLACLLEQSLAQQAGLAGDDDLLIQRFIHPSLGYRIVKRRPRQWRKALSQDASSRHARRRQWLVIDPDGRLLGAEPASPDTATAAMQLAIRHAGQYHGLISRPAFSNRYEYVSLAGGGDYREWLLTLPDYPRTLFTQHYTERNVLAHVRTKVRRDDRGRALLFIEEIQSDWHQNTHRSRHGSRWRGEVPLAPFRKEWVALALKLMLMHACREGLQGIAWATAAIQQARYGLDNTNFQRLYDREIPSVLRHLSGPWQVAIEETQIQSRDPDWRLQRRGHRWMLINEQTGYRTRARLEYERAQQLYRQHARPRQLTVPVLLIPSAMREHINREGLPLFGVNGIDPVVQPLCGTGGPILTQEGQRSRCERCLAQRSECAS